MQLTGVAPLDRALGGLEPGLPLVLAGSGGSGRTLLCLELAATALARGERVTLLTAEPPALLLRQAESLGLGLGDGLREGRLVLLEIVPGAPLALQSHGVGPLVEALRSEAPDTDLWILDPMTDLCREIIDERPLHDLLRGILGELAGTEALLVATADTESLRENPLVERVLQNLCGHYGELSRQGNEGSLLQLRKSRSVNAELGEIRFRMGSGGSELLEGESVSEPIRRPRVLVVVDDARQRESWTAWLSARWEVATASNGVEALSRVMAEPPQLIVLSLHLSRVPGREVLLSIRQGGVGVPVLIVLPENGRVSDRVGALVLGATDIVQLPFERVELIHRVEGMLRLPADEAPRVDYDGQLFASMEGPRSRSLPREQFSERVERALVFGEESDLESSVLFVEAPDDAHFDAFVAAADDCLRAEDAILSVSERNALVLLVATSTEEAARAVHRLGTRYSEICGDPQAGLGWVAVSAAELKLNDLTEDWKDLRQRLESWLPAASG